MLDFQQPDADEARDNAVFDAILQGLARPGRLNPLPEPGLLPIGLALIDRECCFMTDDPVLAAALGRTGAAPGPLAEADHVFLALDTADAITRLDRIRTGDALYPDDGGTLVAPAVFGTGREKILSGPGIETTVSIRLDGIHPRFWTLRERLCAYPLGFETLLVDGDRVMALPRSTTVREV